jgi:hypothetical protein
MTRIIFRQGKTDMGLRGPSVCCYKKAHLEGRLGQRGSGGNPGQ